MGIEDHPGYFGITSRGVIAVHADWPMYPFEHGWAEALLALGSLPSATRFFQIDNIDKCFLFVAEEVPAGRDFEYSEAILTIALPALQEFYSKAYDGLALNDLTGPDLMREICVAQAYAAEVRKDPALPTGLLLHTFKCRYQEPLIIGQANLLFDDEGNMVDLGWDRFEINRRLHSKLDGDFDRRGSVVGDGISFSCKICGEIGLIVGIEAEAYVLNGEKAVDPCSLFCPSCGLNIPKRYRVLAKLHYGPITESAVGAKEWQREISL
jgi:hypothetical protein